MSGTKRRFAAAACVAAALAATGCATTLRRPQFEPTSTQVAGPAVVPVEVAPNGIPSVAVRIDGRPARMMVDTGAAANLLSDSFADRSNLVVEATSHYSVDAGGKVARSTGMAHAASVTFDGTSLALGGVDLIVSPLASFGGYDGVLGLPAFAGGLMSLDLAGKRLTVEPGGLPAADGRTILACDVGKATGWTVPVEVGGHRLRATLDSGYSSTIFVPAATADALPGGARRLPFGSVRAWGGPIRQGLASLQEDVVIGRFRIHRPAVNVGVAAGAADGRAAGGRAAGDGAAVIGVGVLRSFVVTFDTRGRRVRLTPNASAASGVLYVNALPIPGLEVDPRTFRVVAVAPQSLALLLGLRVGDEVTHVEHVPVAQLGAVELPKPGSAAGFAITVRRNGTPFGIFVPTPG